MAFTWFDLFFFVLERNFTHFSRTQATIWDGTASKCQPVALSLLFSFGDTILAWEVQSLLGGHKELFGGHGPKMPPPPWHRACVVAVVDIVDVVSIAGLEGVVDVVGLVNIVSK